MKVPSLRLITAYSFLAPKKTVNYGVVVRVVVWSPEWGFAVGSQQEP